MHLFDNYVFVIEWANTSRDVVRDAMLSVEPARQRFVGAILNKADPAELKRLEAYRGAAYGNYYVEADAA
jgi:succinoglycan biosynthesis transport protein ExoP